MNDQFLSILPSAVVLGTAGVIALGLTLTRGWANESRTHIRGAVHIVLVVILLQAAHFVEELSAGLHERLPALFGLPPMSLQFFVSFNVAWLAIWSLSSWGLATHHRAAAEPRRYTGKLVLLGCFDELFDGKSYFISARNVPRVVIGNGQCCNVAWFCGDDMTSGLPNDRPSKFSSVLMTTLGRRI